jgi:hypothetical protein
MVFLHTCSQINNDDFFSNKPFLVPATPMAKGFAVFMGGIDKLCHSWQMAMVN